MSGAAGEECNTQQKGDNEWSVNNDLSGWDIGDPYEKTLGDRTTLELDVTAGVWGEINTSGTSVDVGAEVKLYVVCNGSNSTNCSSNSFQ